MKIDVLKTSERVAKIRWNLDRAWRLVGAVHPREERVHHANALPVGVWIGCAEVVAEVPHSERRPFLKPLFVSSQNLLGVFSLAVQQFLTNCRCLCPCQAKGTKSANSSLRRMRPVLRVRASLGMGVCCCFPFGVMGAY